eukprot:TRINITY_DN3030_c0_g1_i1.p1 TRINITY_DN3030_c0_g1~~TRINITY_DN3030_c0_g1_i1.p1  ORF type:complete len:268 (+),score=68.76 TRINITY_DN3030_c0_g1_i1:210-1013(+)
MSRDRTTLDLTEGINEFSSRMTLKNFFCTFGEVAACWVPPLEHRGKEPAYVKFHRAEAAQAAYDAITTQQFCMDGSVLKCEWRKAGGKVEDSRDFDAKGSNLVSSRDLFLQKRRGGDNRGRDSRGGRDNRDNRGGRSRERRRGRSPSRGRDRDQKKRSRSRRRKKKKSTSSSSSSSSSSRKKQKEKEKDKEAPKPVASQGAVPPPPPQDDVVPPSAVDYVPPSDPDSKKAVPVAVAAAKESKPAAPPPAAAETKKSSGGAVCIDLDD